MWACPSYTWTAVIAVVSGGLLLPAIGGGDGWPPCPLNRALAWTGGRDLGGCGNDGGCRS